MTETLQNNLNLAAFAGARTLEKAERSVKSK